METREEGSEGPARDVVLSCGSGLLRVPTLALQVSLPLWPRNCYFMLLSLLALYASLGKHPVLEVMNMETVT